MAEEPNEYDLQREERIRRNKAMLAKLQVKEKVNHVAAPLLAAQREKARAKEAIRQKYVVLGPARKSERAGAQQTRAKLQRQAKQLDASSDEEQSCSSGSSRDDKASQSDSGIDTKSRKRKRSVQEADYDPTDMPEPSSSEGEEEEETSAPNADGGEDAEDIALQQALAMSLEGHAGGRTEPNKELQTMGKRKSTQVPAVAEGKSSKHLPQASAASRSKAPKAAAKGRKAKLANRIGLIKPTLDEMKTAFSLFNPHGRSVITSEDFSRVAAEQGYNFDEDEMKAMMEVAASITERASLTSMTFQGFQMLVEHYSTSV